jgi:hypothetical protein
MTDAITKLREPAALGAAAFAALVTLAAVVSLLFNSGGSFSDNAYGQTGNLLGFPVAAAVAIAVYLANHAGPAVAKARLVTLIALAAVAAAGVFGLVSFFAGFGAQTSGTDKFSYFLGGAGGAIVIGLAAWYAWLTWQTHAPARPAAPVAPGVPGGWAPGPQQPGGMPQQHPQHQQAAPGQPVPPPAGFGWKPGNATEQTAYLPPQNNPHGPQTLQAQQSSTGSYSVQPPAPGPQPGPVHAGQPGQPGQPQPGQPGQPQPGQPGPVGHGQGAQGGGERTQMIPPVPPTMKEYAPDPQPWQPHGPGGSAVPQPPPARPMAPGEGPSDQERGGNGPFGVGSWQ